MINCKAHVISNFKTCLKIPCLSIQVVLLYHLIFKSMYIYSGRDESSFITAVLNANPKCHVKNQ